MILKNTLYIFIQYKQGGGSLIKLVKIKARV